MFKVTKNIKFCLGFLLMGLFVHLLAFSLPFWNYISENNDGTTNSFRLISLGLWQACFKLGEEQWCQGYTAYKGFIAVRIFECLSLLGYVAGLVLLLIYSGLPINRARLILVVMSDITASVVLAVLGILIWTLGSGTAVQYNLSWSFGLAILSLIFTGVSISFIEKERRLNCKTKQNDSATQPEQSASFI